MVLLRVGLASAALLFAVGLATEGWAGYLCCIFGGPSPGVAVAAACVGTVAVASLPLPAALIRKSWFRFLLAPAVPISACTVLFALPVVLTGESWTTIQVVSALACTIYVAANVFCGLRPMETP